jgi:hypothetical protein
MVAIRSVPSRSTQPPLQAPAFARLTPGSVRPRGWLETQLKKQLAGLHGQLPKLSRFIDESTSGWIDPDSTASGWEEVPYWLRGYVSLAIALGDGGALATARRWVDGTIRSQQPDGYFGPRMLRGGDGKPADVWPHLPQMQAVRTYGEHVGDARVVPFFVAFFRWLAAAIHRDGKILTGQWVNYRWADALDLIAWTYSRQPRPELLRLARTIHEGSASWLNPGALPTPHNVNIAQGFREPALYSQFSRSAAHREATYAVYDTLMEQYGQFPGGGFAGDENVRKGYADPRQGFELCGVVDMMASHEQLARITGDARWADRVEDLAFNNLVAGIDFEGKGVHYVNSANCVALLDRTPAHGQFDNKFPMQPYSGDPNGNYRCCAHNYGIGWPYYLEEMWVRHASDEGIVANLHGPSVVTFAVAGGDDDDDAIITIRADGTYPFSESMVYTVDVSRPVRFNFWVRVPSWADLAEFAGPIDGHEQTLRRRGDTYHLAVAGHEWRSGDQLAVRFNMAMRAREWPGQHGAVSLHFGPQAFSVRIEEEWARVGGGPSAAWPTREVRPLSPWNYAIVREHLPMAQITRSHGNHVDPWSPDNTPLKGSVVARRVRRWRADVDGVVEELGTLGESPLDLGGEGEEEATLVDVALVPMGAARLRLTMFPTV